jgi:cytosine/uracil/thiamine/allantoin permease
MSVRTNNDLQNTTEKDRHYNGQKITDKRTNNDLQNTTEKERHYNGQKIADKRTNNDLQNTFGHGNVCPSL